MIKSNKYIIIIILLSQATLVWSQLPQASWELNTNESGNSKNYVARKFVKLNKDFSFKATSGTSFDAKIDETLYKSQDYIAQQQIVDESQIYPDRTINKTIKLGSIPGQIDVNASGSASYTMGIDLPAGPSGIKPNLSIVYNSGGGNSCLGHKFQLAGISKIGITPRDQYFDGATIEASQEGPFSLDGERMLTLNGLNFKTEKENYLTITKNGSPTAYCWFKVENTKTNQIIEYGNGNNSGGPLNQGTFYWNVSKIKDQFNNELNFIYRPYQSTNLYDEKIVNTQDENVLDKITYGKGVYEIQFIYSLRDDDYHLNTRGVHTGISTLLDKIYIKKSGSILSSYEFKYKKNSVGMSCLIEVIKKNRLSEQLNSTVFRWNEPVNIQQNMSLTEKQLPVTIRPFDKNTDFIGDFNNDGITDLLLKKDNSSYDLYQFNGGGIPTKKTYTKPQQELISCGDFNGDGRIELLGYKDRTCYLLSVNPNEIAVVMESKILIDKPSPAIADINKNGIAEFFYKNATDNGIYMCEFRPGANMVQQVIGYTTDDLQSIYDIKTIDVNNDGLNDIIINGDFTGIASTENLQFQITKNTTLVNAYNCRGNKIDYGVFDINNDGKTEKLTHNILNGFNPIADYNGDGDTDDSFVCYYSRSFLSVPEPDQMIFPWDDSYETIDNLYNEDPLGSSYLKHTVDESNYRYPIQYQKADFQVENSIVGPISVEKSRETDFNGDGVPEYLLWAENTSTYLGDNMGRSILIFPASKSNQSPTYKFWYGIYGYYIGDFNGDGATDIIDGNTLYYCPNPQTASVATIIDGNNNKTQINYSRVKDTGVSGKPVYPFANGVGPFNVVSSIVETVGEKSDTTNYTYKDSRFHLEGKGYLGFSKFIEETEHTRTTTDYTFHDTYAFPISTKVLVENKYNNGYYRLSESETLVEVQPMNLIDYKRYAVQKITTTQSDLYNNITIQEQEFNVEQGYLIKETLVKCRDKVDPITKTETIYSQYNARNLPQNVTKLFSRKNIDNPISQTTSCTYYDNGTLHTITEKGTTKTYTYDDWGNVLTCITSGSDPQSETYFAPQTDTYKYDDLHINMTDYINAKNQSITKKCDDWGNLVEETDLNGNITTHSYDAWGDLLSSKSPDGHIFNIQKTWADNSAPQGSYYYTTLSKDGVLEKKDYFDHLGQNIRKITTGTDGIQLCVDNTYDRRGNIESTTEPYPLNGQASLITTNNYNDNYGRIKSQTTPTLTTTFEYGINNVTSKSSYNGKDVISFKETDASGFLTTVIDNGGKIQYIPTVDNLVSEIHSPGVQSYLRITTIAYDIYRRKTELNDADAGKTSYTYFDNGNVKTQTNANDKLVSYTYDVLNRVKTESRTENGRTTVYTYVYDANKSFGLLTSITSDSDKKEEESYKYDEAGLGRVIEKTRKTNEKTLTYKYGYDSKGRVNSMTYPGNFAIAYEYNDFDDLKTIRNASTNAVIWHLDKANALGQKENVTYGNGKQITYGYDPQHRLNSIFVPDIIRFNYEFNNRQQLNSRTEEYKNGTNWVGFTESFTFDNLNRLETATINGDVKTMTYNVGVSNNQIDKKTGVGKNFTYNLGIGSIPLINSKLQSVDVSGTSYRPTQHEITYTSRLKVDSIKDKINATKNRVLNIQYGIDNERFKQTYTDEGGQITTTWFTDRYEEKELPGGVIQKLNYIFAGNEMVAINVQKSDVDNGVMHYVYTDYLGSLRCITNVAGTVEYKLGFDAWGNRRNPETGEMLTAAPAGIFTARGFTGHEHLDAFGLINMNGRVYDPVISMFLSPDPYIQAPDMTQNFNRYSYCLNNPLMYTDPSGEFIFSLFLGPLGVVLDKACWGALIGGVGYTVSTAFSRGGFKNWSAKGFWKSVGTGAISGAVTFGIGQAFGAVGGGFNTFGDKLAHELGRAFTHGVAQGMIAGYTGGNMLQSFASGAFGSLGGSAFQGVGGKFAGSFTGTVGFSALSGGIGAELSGGDFWRGATTGALIGALNHGVHAAANAIKRFNNIPSTYSYKNGEQIVFKGHVYELHNNQWLFLSGEMVDIAAISGHTNGGVYIPISSNFVDRAIYEADLKLVVGSGTNGIFTGIVIDAISKFKLPKINGLATIITSVYNMYDGIFNQINENIYHDQQVTKLRQP